MTKISRLFVVAILFSFFTPLLSAGDKLNNDKQSAITNLQKFAYASCLMGYFKKHKLGTNDITAIAGGFVEMGSSSIESYQAIADYVAQYESARQTKQNIDKDLLKCFFLEENVGLQALIEKAVE